MKMRPATILLAVVAALALWAGSLADAGAATSPSPSYAPLNRPGPRLDVLPAKLKASLSCKGDPRTGGEPVLLNPATSVTPAQDYSWTYEKAFTAQHRYWCAVTMPFHTFGDIQTAGEYLVHAIRVMHRRTGRRIAILGHSQGGMSMRWALRFWPDTRPMVDDVIGMAGSNHGTTALPSCIPGVTKCTPAVWQQLARAKFIKALNSRAETFHSISYTEVFTHLDEVVTPNGRDSVAVSALHTGQGAISNVAVQDICPADTSEHLMVGTTDPVTYALVMDALHHRGPAVPARVSRTVCHRAYMPYVDPADVNTYLQPLSALGALASTPLPYANTVRAPEVSREPRLRCFVYAAGC